MIYVRLVILFVLFDTCLFARQPSYTPCTPDLQLNVHPGRYGLFNAPGFTSLGNYCQLREENFGKDLLKHASVIKKERAYTSGNKKTEVITFMVLKESVKLNCLVLKEAVQFGEVIENMDIVLSDHGTEVRKLNITTVGHKRILTFPTTEVSELSFIITSAKMKPHLEEVMGYLVDEKLVEKYN